ncbi:MULTISPECIES: hypothetical protein [Ectopseudomonas]|uniref:Uncharacterized protein n=2 Tax=Ectopseudomonas TaxID=3236654 RepID=A0A1G6PV61_9GAMM|nr:MULTISPECIES: hypothetical protein [Pseudomonas]ALN21925.1 hypothetical protein DW68_024930 [Pseudomonas mendocina S5.2]MBP3061915.1 hypothetical protein [Pseudomonas chengduensis]NNB75207.1 hypothetical protein [Pseudomonas chengduensis]OEO24552.1 hypothetical protein AX279_17960 [Pseudomonas sp. J237]SDC83245.1 hypothetical protein SAMN05216576_10781 [Pseudomonas chengduensis]
MANTERNSSQVLVPLNQHEDFKKRLAALNAKATKFGLEPIVAGEPVAELYTIKTEEANDGEAIVTMLVRAKTSELNDPTRAPQLVRMLRIDLDYPIIKLGNWRVVAQVEKHSRQGDNLLFVVSTDQEDHDHAEQHRSGSVSCQHCNTRRARKLSYILKDEATGEYKEVGSTCLEDFTGINPAAALFLAQLYSFHKLVDYSDPDAGYGGGPTSYGTIDYLMRVLFVSERYGFMSAAKARDLSEEPTYRLACSLPHALRNDKALMDAYSDAASRLHDTAEKIVEWYAAMECSSSFDRNVKVLLSSDDLLMDNKHLAFAAGAVPAYLRHLAESAQAAIPSSYVGKPGEKIVGEFTVERVVHFNGRFGPQIRLNFRDADGNKLSWKTGSAPDYVTEAGAIGQQFKARFKVKKHDEYKGVKSTDVTHLKIEAWGDAAS